MRCENALGYAIALLKKNTPLWFVIMNSYGDTFCPSVAWERTLTETDGWTEDRIRTDGTRL